MEKSKGLTPADWHARYQLQVGWTAGIRDYLYRRASLADARWVLEVGCGSGAVTPTLHGHSQAKVVGLDIDRLILKLATVTDTGSNFINGDALHLPLAGQIFDVVLCHYFLLWVRSPLAVLLEMVRVCRPGGAVLALAEPDHAARIDHPRELETLGKLQTESLEHQGADPQAGRQLARWFHQAGLAEIETGVLSGQWINKPSDSFLESEWQMLEHDLGGNISPAELDHYQRVDRSAWADGSRVLHVPTFYAAGKVK
jgi:ubiquinone/menaquinone biosynthesis C-methylase UbiE